MHECRKVARVARVGAVGGYEIPAARPPPQQVRYVSGDLVEIAQLNAGEKLFPFSPCIRINGTIR